MAAISKQTVNGLICSILDSAVTKNAAAIAEYADVEEKLRNRIAATIELPFDT